MKITLDLKGTSAEAISQTLRIRRDQLQDELASIDDALAQLSKIADMPKPEQTDTGRLKHGETEKAVLEYLKRAVIGWEVNQEELMQRLGTSHTSTFRALKKLESEGKIRRGPKGNWVLANDHLDADTSP